MSVSLQFLHEPLAFFRPHPLTNLERRGRQRLLAAEPGTPEKLRIDLDEFSVGEPADGHQVRDRVEQLADHGLAPEEQLSAPLEFGRALGDLLFDAGVGGFQVGLALGEPHHLLEALHDRDDEKDILEDHPSRVLDPAPGLNYVDSINSLRREYPKNAMMDGRDRRGGDQHVPIAIKGQQGERAEDVEVGLDPAGGNFDQQGGKQHLAHRDRMARERAAGTPQHQHQRERGQRAAEKNRRPHVDVDRAFTARPGRRREPQRSDDCADPLHRHQAGEEMVGLPEDAQAQFVEQDRRAPRVVRLPMEFRVYL